jgi:hypothetical protein
MHRRWTHRTLLPLSVCLSLLLCRPPAFWRSSTSTKLMSLSKFIIAKRSAKRMASWLEDEVKWLEKNADVTSFCGLSSVSRTRIGVIQTASHETLSPRAVQIRKWERDCRKSSEPSEWSIYHLRNVCLSVYLPLHLLVCDFRDGVWCAGSATRIMGHIFLFFIGCFWCQNDKQRTVTSSFTQIWTRATC